LAEGGVVAFDVAFDVAFAGCPILAIVARVG